MAADEQSIVGTSETEKCQSRNCNSVAQMCRDARETSSDCQAYNLDADVGKKRIKQGYAGGDGEECGYTMTMGITVWNAVMCEAPSGCLRRHPKNMARDLNS